MAPTIGESRADAGGSRTRVVEVTAESGVNDPPEIPLHLMPQPGDVAIQLRSTVSRIAMGAGLARRPDVVAQVRAISGANAVTSPVGGTIVLTGPGVLGICAIGRPPEGASFGLDWMLSRVSEWFEVALASVDIVDMAVGRVEGAWCPGFSDIAVEGRKLVGLGFRMTRDWVVARGVMPVEQYTAEQWSMLAACHRVIGVTVDPQKSTSLRECVGDRLLTAAGVIERWKTISA